MSKVLVITTSLRPNSNSDRTLGYIHFLSTFNGIMNSKLPLSAACWEHGSQAICLSARYIPSECDILAAARAI